MDNDYKDASLPQPEGSAFVYTRTFCSGRSSTSSSLIDCLQLLPFHLQGLLPAIHPHLLGQDRFHHHIDSWLALFLFDGDFLFLYLTVIFSMSLSIITRFPFDNSLHQLCFQPGSSICRVCSSKTMYVFLPSSYTRSGSPFGFRKILKTNL